MAETLKGIGKPLPIDAAPPPPPERAARQETPDISSLKMTPQETNIWLHHLYNLGHIGTGGVRNPDASVSTVFQTSVEGPDGRTYNIPTVWGGEILPPREAIARAISGHRTWEYWPSYESVEEAEKRYQEMHKFFESSP